MNVAFGYLSVLIGYLCMNKDVRKRVRSGLPGGTLQQLLHAMQEFLHYHLEIEEATRTKVEDTDIRALFISRVQNVINDLALAEAREGDLE